VAEAVVVILLARVVFRESQPEPQPEPELERSRDP